jgi:hypothetical protein
MPTAEPVEWPQGTPLFEAMWRAVTESLAGNGIESNGDLEVTATANALEIEVAAGTLFYAGTDYQLGSASTVTLSSGDGTHDRWDTVYLDTATTSVGVRGGTPAADPEPPDVSGDEALLAVVYVPQNATDVPSSDIYNWRAQFSNKADKTQYADSTGVYSVSTVAAALDELQEAAQLSQYPLPLATDTEATAYPLALSDLASPYALPDITDMDANGTDLSDSAGPGTIYDASAGTILQGVLGGPPASLSAYPLLIGTDVAAHLDGSDLLDSSGGVTVYSQADGWVPRAQVEDHRDTSATKTSAYTTSGEEVVPVDTTGGSVTITIASADATTGAFVTVSDVGGAAGTSAITVEVEGANSESLDGGTSTTIDSNYGATVLFSPDGTNWVTAGGGGGGGAALVVQDDGSTVEDPVDTLDTQAGLAATSPTTGEVEVNYEHQEVFEGRESGAVSDTNQGILVIDSLADGQTVEVYKAALTNADGTAVASSVDLELVTLDNSGGFTSQATLISGDGSTVYDRETGSPLGSYTNSSGGAQTIGVLVDNGSGGSVTIMASVEGVTGA